MRAKVIQIESIILCDIFLQKAFETIKSPSPSIGRSKPLKDSLRMSNKPIGFCNNMHGHRCYDVFDFCRCWWMMLSKFSLGKAEYLIVVLKSQGARRGVVIDRLTLEEETTFAPLDELVFAVRVYHMRHPREKSDLEIRPDSTIVKYADRYCLVLLVGGLCGIFFRR